LGPRAASLGRALATRPAAAQRAWRFLGPALVASLLLADTGAARAEAPGLHEALERARAIALADEPEWRRLLHIPPGRRRSEVLSADFFLADAGGAAPAIELEATIRGWFASGPAGDEHPRCRFPARYQWLEARLALRAPPIACPRFERWARFADMRSVSLLMVSAYLGNPASSFGHSLLTFNYDTPSGPNALLDLSFNFGALVPPGEWTPVYVLKGLSGGYQAGFSDKLYYAEDQVYTRTEFRDIWSYRLVLSENERRMLVGHLWELTGRKFRYFFLTRNCAFRMTELLSVALDREVTPRVHLWYVPVELFFEIDGLRSNAGTPFADAINFIPSSQRSLYHAFRSLRADEVRAANQVIRSGPATADGALADIPEDRRRAVLEALIAYYEYRIVGGGEKPDPAFVKAKVLLLRARLALPPSSEGPPPTPELPAPTTGHAPFLTAIGFENVAGEARAAATFTAFAQDGLGAEGGERELIVADGTASISTRGNLRLDRVDLIRLRKLHAETVPIEGESSLSWQMQLGAERSDPEHEGLVPRLTYGVGRAASMGESALIWALADGAVERGGLVAGPDLGLITRFGTIPVATEVAEDYLVAAHRWHARWSLEARVTLGRDLQLALSVGNGERDTTARILLNVYR
jgi:hypothetical protein